MSNRGASYYGKPYAIIDDELRKADKARVTATQGDWFCAAKAACLAMRDMSSAGPAALPTCMSRGQKHRRNFVVKISELRWATHATSESHARFTRVAREWSSSNNLPWRRNCPQFSKLLGDERG